MGSAEKRRAIEAIIGESAAPPWPFAVSSIAAVGVVGLIVLHMVGRVIVAEVEEVTRPPAVQAPVAPQRRMVRQDWIRTQAEGVVFGAENIRTYHPGDTDINAYKWLYKPPGYTLCLRTRRNYSNDGWKRWLIDGNGKLDGYEFANIWGDVVGVKSPPVDDAHYRILKVVDPRYELGYYWVPEPRKVGEDGITVCR